MSKRMMRTGLMTLIIAALLVGGVGVTLFAQPVPTPAAGGQAAISEAESAEVEDAKEVGESHDRDTDNDQIQYEFEGEQEHED